MSAWHRHWFTPAAPHALALCRVVLYLGLLLAYAFEDLGFVPALAELRWAPISFFALIAPHGPPSAEVLGALQWAWRASLVAAILGLWTRASTMIAAVLGLYLLGLPYCVSRMSHELAAPALALIVMAFARCGDALSLDARRRPPVVPSLDHRWPIQLVRAIISVAFASAGLAKLRHGGLDWITSDNLLLLIAQRDTPLGRALIEAPALCQALAAATVIIELFHPLALLDRRAAALWVPAGVAMLVGSYLALGVPFWPLVVLHVFWLPGAWFERVGRALQRITSASAPPITSTHSSTP